MGRRGAEQEQSHRRCSLREPLRWIGGGFSGNKTGERMGPDNVIPRLVIEFGSELFPNPIDYLVIRVWIRAWDRTQTRLVVGLGQTFTDYSRSTIRCRLFADIRIPICLQHGYGYHFFTSINIHIRLRRLGADTNIIKAIFDSYPIRYPKVLCLIMIYVWKRLFFNGMR